MLIVIDQSLELCNDLSELSNGIIIHIIHVILYKT